LFCIIALNTKGIKGRDAETGSILVLNTEKDFEVLKVLGSDLRILGLLNGKKLNVNEIAKTLSIPPVHSCRGRQSHGEGRACERREPEGEEGFSEALNGPGLSQIVLPEEAELCATFRPELLGGVVVLSGEAEKEVAASSRLYTFSRSQRRRVPITAIPYYAWGNRGMGEMTVWIREK